MRTVGACSFIGLVSVCTFFWSRVAESILDGLPAEAARSLDVGIRKEQVQTMLEDALADIGPTLGLPFRDTVCVRDYNRCPEGENRRVCDVCKFSKHMFAEGW